MAATDAPAGAPDVEFMRLGVGDSFGEMSLITVRTLSAVEWSGVEWSGVEWSGVEWSGVEWERSMG
jgi:hypothetical protein